MGQGSLPLSVNHAGAMATSLGASEKSLHLYIGISPAIITDTEIGKRFVSSQIVWRPT